MDRFSDKHTVYLSVDSDKYDISLFVLYNKDKGMFYGHKDVVTSIGEKSGDNLTWDNGEYVYNEYIKDPKISTQKSICGDICNALNIDYTEDVYTELRSMWLDMMFLIR